MDGPLDLRHTIPCSGRWPVAAIVVCALGSFAACSQNSFSAEYADPFESSRTSWEVHSDPTRVQVGHHRRNFDVAHTGEASEHIRLIATDDDTVVRLEHRVDASLVHGDLRASVWVLGSRPGAVLSMHVRLPHQIDPRTEKPLEFELRGEPYTQTERWEQLSVAATEEAVERQLVLWRRRLTSAGEGKVLDTRDARVERLSLVVPISRGVTELLTDDLAFGPVVRPNGPANDLLQATHPRERQESPIRLGPKQLLVQGRPFFPRFAAYQGENLDTLRDMGLNVALIERYDEQILIDELERRDIWGMAAPPQATLADEELEGATNVGLMPIPASTERILFWMLGTRIPADELRKVERWIDQIRDADRAFTRPRPIMADVISEERAFSRHVSLIGSSRHCLHTTFSPREYRDYLNYKRLLALPDRFPFTWIQTEPAPPNVATRHPSRDRPIFVEAEQIWMQAWAAISVGHRAIGFWKSTPFDDETPAARERRVAIALLNAQIDLLEPLLATGKVVDNIPVSILSDKQSRGQQAGSRLIPSLRRPRQPRQIEHPEIRAAVIESSYGLLVIPNWYQAGAQFQPGDMSAREVSFVVRGVEHARAWEVSTTNVRPLDINQPLPGGTEFRLPLMDQVAFVVISNDLEWEKMLTRRMRKNQQRCARLWVELARVRLDRVRPTHEILQQTARSKVKGGSALLQSASQRLDEAEIQLHEQHFNEARRLSRLSLRLLRRLQRAHWDNAVAGLSSPVSSPHTLCFNTLPDHWRMVASIGRSAGESNDPLLRSGNFEDFDTVVADGWDVPHITPPEEGDVRTVELLADAYEGKYALRLLSRSAATEGVQPVPSSPNIVVFSPRIPVQGGQIAVISGRLRVQEPITGHPDGLMVYDNIKGTVGALRWHGRPTKGKWQQFRLIREVAHSRDLQLYFELNGDGDVRLDDVRVVALSPLQTAGGSSARPDRPRRKLLDFAPGFPKVPQWFGRGTEPPQD